MLEALGGLLGLLAEAAVGVAALYEQLGIGMKSSMISFSTNNKDTLKQIADRFNSKDYMIVSYEMETQHSGEMESYQVTQWSSNQNGTMMKDIYFR